MIEELIEIIKHIAQIPSFTMYEERAHPFIFNFAKENEIICDITQHYNNLVLEINKGIGRPVAFTAHLDKIDHFNDHVKELEFKSGREHIEGQLDDAVGVAVCLYLLKYSKKLKLPHCLFLFSEMEEGYGIRNLRDCEEEDMDLEPQMGAKRISEYLIKRSIIPSVIITIDTTPLFGGDPGIALYSKFWQISGDVPMQETLKRTEEIEKLFFRIHSDIKFANNINDYVKYGKIFAENGFIVPSIALEPSIYPYHTICERVSILDIEKVTEILIKYIELQY